MSTLSTYPNSPTLEWPAMRWRRLSISPPLYGALALKTAHAPRLPAPPSSSPLTPNALTSLTSTTRLLPQLSPPRQPLCVCVCELSGPLSLSLSQNAVGRPWFLSVSSRSMTRMDRARLTWTSSATWVRSRSFCQPLTNPHNEHLIVYPLPRDSSRAHGRASASCPRAPQTVRYTNTRDPKVRNHRSLSVRHVGPCHPLPLSLSLRRLSGCTAESTAGQ